MRDYPNQQKRWLGEEFHVFHHPLRQEKAYSEDHAAEIGFKSASNITHIAPEMSIFYASINLNIGIIIGTPLDEATTAYHDYVEGLEESLLGAK